jgi:hypothetical protein
MRTRRLRTLSLVALLAPAACTESVPAPVLAPPEPGLAVEPSWLTFTCVRPGCDTKLAATVKVVGDRDLAVKRVVLSDRDRTDITLQAGRQPPFILKASETFAVEVSYKPTGDPRLGDVEVLVTYTDASASEEDDRVKAGELKIPLVRRLVGEPTLQVSPEVLDFGPVLPGARKTLPLTISNVGFGNVGLVLESIRSDLVDVSVSNMPSVAILPMDTWNVDVTFAPQDEAYTAGSLTVRSADPAAPTPVVRVVGTSIPRANILVEPARGVDFGEVPRMMSGTARMTITNQGAEDLLLSAVEIVNAPAAATLDVRLPRLALTTPLRPLASITATLTLSGMQAGPVDARVRITSSDVLSPITEIPVLGIITEPNVLVGPPALEFGAVPRGWVVTRPIEVVNSGYGDLVITGVSMVLGSSELFTLRSVSLPVTLRHDQRTALEVEFRSEVEAPLTGKVSIDTNDPDQPFVEVDLRATGASCDQGCPHRQRHAHLHRRRLRHRHVQRRLLRHRPRPGDGLRVRRGRPRSRRVLPGVAVRGHPGRRRRPPERLGHHLHRRRPGPLPLLRPRRDAVPLRRLRRADPPRVRRSGHRDVRVSPRRRGPRVGLLVRERDLRPQLPSRRELAGRRQRRLHHPRAPHPELGAHVHPVHRVHVQRLTRCHRPPARPPASARKRPRRGRPRS